MGLQGVCEGDGTTKEVMELQGGGSGVQLLCYGDMVIVFMYTEVSFAVTVCW